MSKDPRLDTYVKQESFYKAVVEDGSDIIFIVDYAGLILYHNPAVFGTLGYPSDSLVGEIFFDYINPKLRNKFIKVFKKCTERPYSKNIEFHFRKADQSYRYLEFNAINLQHKEEIKGFILDCRDIEQRKRDAEELIRAKNTKEQFLANMSHEIRTPINGIAGMVNLLAGTNPSVEQQKFLSAIKNSSDNLKVIVNDILDLSAIESGKLSLEKIGFKVSSLVYDVVEIFQYQAEEKKINLTYEIANEKEIVVLGDPVRLSQILINLIGNALKFTFTGEISIRVEFVQKAKDLIKVVFKIKDSGIGIPDDKLETIFESFRQADESVTRKYGGTGLGLSIVKQLVDLQNGSIWVESKENKGSTFTFSIDYVEGGKQDLVAKTPDSTIPHEANSLTGMKVLLVEDNDINRLYASNLLRKWDCMVDEAENGLICVEKLNKEDYDVILMDIQMPVMDGFEATKSIRNSFDPPKSETPIIALTANAVEGDIEKYFKVGMNDHLSKPFVPNKLLSVLGKYYKANPVENYIEDRDFIEEQAKNKSIENISGVTSLNYLESISNGDMEFVKEMVTTFIDTTPDSLQKIKEALDSGDYVAVGNLAHRIKPSISFVGIDILKGQVKEIELLGKQNGDEVLLKKKTLYFLKIMEEAIIELKEKLDRMT